MAGSCAKLRVAGVAFLAFLTLSSGASAGGDPSVAASQIALRAGGFYHGPVDGVGGAETRAAIRNLQSTHGLSADGVIGRRTAGLLGVFAPRRLGSRSLYLHEIGWDVAELQFALAWQGFPSGRFDGRFGLHLAGALRRFQASVALTPDGVVGPTTLAALRLQPPTTSVPLAWPVSAPVGDRFGPRGDRFHAGIDLVAPSGAPVSAAASGRVVWVGPRAGWGLVVTLAHDGGVRTMYAHLLMASVRLGQRVRTGTQIGAVGATGDATGPHLHFEVRIKGAATDPLLALR